jgi:hypothetical protein
MTEQTGVHTRTRRSQSASAPDTFSTAFVGDPSSSIQGPGRELPPSSVVTMHFMPTARQAHLLHAETTQHITADGQLRHGGRDRGWTAEGGCCRNHGAPVIAVLQLWQRSPPVVAPFGTTHLVRACRPRRSIPPRPGGDVACWAVAESGQSRCGAGREGCSATS